MEQRNTRMSNKWSNEYVIHSLLTVSLWALILGSFLILGLSISGFLEQLHLEHFKISYSAMWFLCFLLHFFVPMVRKLMKNVGPNIGMDNKS